MSEVPFPKWVRSVVGLWSIQFNVARRWSRVEANPARPDPLHPVRLFGIVGTWCEADVIEATVQNAFAQGCERVFIVDNESPDDTLERAAAAGAEIGSVYHTDYYEESRRLAEMTGLISAVSPRWPPTTCGGCSRMRTSSSMARRACGSSTTWRVWTAGSASSEPACSTTSRPVSRERARSASHGLPGHVPGAADGLVQPRTGSILLSAGTGPVRTSGWTAAFTGCGPRSGWESRVRACSCTISSTATGQRPTSGSGACAKPRKMA